MATKARVFNMDAALARKLCRGVQVGSRFVFLDTNQLVPEPFDFDTGLHPAIAAGQLGRMTIGLSSFHRTKLPGIAFRAVEDPKLHLYSLTTDRDLYRYLHDVVNVLVIDLKHPGTDVAVTLESAGTPYAQQTVSLDESGVGIAQFPELPVGSYRVSCKVDSLDDYCSFQVAAFELAPLTATIKQLTLNGERLGVKLYVTRFGCPVDDAVRIDLFDQKQRIDSRLVRVHEGLALASLEITGEGPHHLEVHLKSQADATATVPLPGSRRTEREGTILSQCGLIFKASLMPGKDQVQSHGLSIEQSGTNNAPVRVSNLHRDRIRLEVMTAVEDCCVVTRPFSSTAESERFTRLGNLTAGQTIEVDASDSCGLLSIGGFVDARPWEECCVLVGEQRLKTTIQVRPQLNQGHIESGTRVIVEVNAGALVDGTAWIVVRDERLQPSERPEQKLAARIKSAAEEAAVDKLEIGHVYAPDADSVFQPRFPSTKPPIDDIVLQHLVVSRVITEEQADDVSVAVHEGGADAYTILLHRGYAESNEICHSIATFYRMEFIDLDEFQISDSIIQLCPESVARENATIPIREDQNELTFAIVDPQDLECIEKLRFILNRRIKAVLASPESIENAINFYYGQIEGESADSILQEFTDTQIDFTESYFDLASPSMLDGGGIVMAAPSKEPVEPKALHQRLDVLYCGIVPVQAGMAWFEVDLPEEPNRYAVDAFVVSGGGWSQAQYSFEADKDPYVKLLVPECLHNGDQAIGRVNARCQSGEFSVRLTCDGAPVELFDASKRSRVSGEHIKAKELELTFAVGIGVYTVTVTDLVSGQTVDVERSVKPLGEIVTTRRSMRLLQPGEMMQLDDEIKRIRLLPNPKSIESMAIAATSNYEHLCCEQSAAKLFASVASLASAINSDGPHAQSQEQRTAIDSIRAGLSRMQDLWVSARGFAIYKAMSPNDFWGAMATRHLLKVDFLAEAVAFSPDGSKWVRDIAMLARAAADVYGIAWPPRSVGNAHDAYAVLVHDQCEGSQAVAMALQMATSIVRREVTKTSATWRCEAALAVACLLRRGNESQVATAMDCANQILDCVRPEGRLYSTFDSVSLLVMLSELSKRKWAHSESQVSINGKPSLVVDALKSNEVIESISSPSELLPVEWIGWHREDWNAFDSRTSVTVELTASQKLSTGFCEGDIVNLKLAINDGYEAGDLWWIALPPSLSRLDGGGQLKQFTIDPEGKSTVSVRLAVTARTYHRATPESTQHFVVCLRNMFDETRVGKPGPIEVRVAAKQIGLASANV